MQPNIVIVMTDQQRADLRKSRGYELDTMPFLDSWASGGVDFSGAYTPNPTCMPARVSMFTGRYPESHKVRTNHNSIDALYTEDLLDVLKKRGYHTALCGKNHSQHALTDFDFCEANGHTGNEEGEDKTPEQIAFGEFLTATRHMESHSPSPGGVEMQHPYRNVSSALSFIDSVPKGDPFFTWVSFAEPHNPFQVPEPYFDMFAPEDLPPLHSSSDDLNDKGARWPWLRRQWESVMGDDIEARINRSRSNYHGMLRLIDDQFKRLIEGLDSRGLSDNTIIIFLSDHGDFVGEYGLIRKGPDLPDILTHIPMIWRGPGVASGLSHDGLFVNIVDILPTLCDFLGIESPFGVQGKSILPLLKNESIPDNEFDIAYSESGFSGLYWDECDALTLAEEGAQHPMVTFDCLNSWTQCGQVRMVRKGDYKLQLDMLGAGYLYNLRSDPFEKNNLWDVSEYAPVQSEMLAELASTMMRAYDPLPVPRNRYRTKVHPKGYWHQGFHSGDPGVRQMPSLSDLADH